MRRCKQFCCPPKLSGCPCCHVTVSLDNSVLLSREHQRKRPALLALSERRPAVQKLRCFKLDSKCHFFTYFFFYLVLFKLFAIWKKALSTCNVSKRSGVMSKLKQVRTCSDQLTWEKRSTILLIIEKMVARVPLCCQIGTICQQSPATCHRPSSLRIIIYSF